MISNETSTKETQNITLPKLFFENVRTFYLVVLNDFCPSATRAVAQQFDGRT